MGMVTACAMEVIRFRQGTSLRLKFPYVLFAGFFVMLMSPKDIVSAIIIGAAWDVLLMRIIREYD